MSSIVRFVSMQLGEQLAATLNCLEFTFSEGGTEIGKGRLILAADRFFRYRPQPDQSNRLLRPCLQTTEIKMA